MIYKRFAMNTRPQYDPTRKQGSALEVTRAQMQGLALVALESAIITHGLARPHNLAFGQDMEQAVRDEGAVPATVGVLDGRIMVGLGQAELERLAYTDAPLKISPRNFAGALLQKSSGGTTLAATMLAASKKDIKVVAAGGIGGVQFEPRFDVSADLKVLAELPMVVVCAGALPTVDFSATIEYLETMGVPVIGYQTDKFPEFLLPGKNLPVSMRLDTVDEIAKFIGFHWGVGQASTVLICQPIAASAALDRKQVEDAASQASKDALKQGVNGPNLTPFLLKRLSDLTGGKSMRAGLNLALNNAKLAAQIARVLAGVERVPKSI